MAKALGHSPGQQDAWSQAGRALGRRRCPRATTTTSPSRVDRPRDAAAEGAAAPRHPLGRHGADRPPGRRGGADRARAHGEPHRHPVGQRRRRLDGAGQVRPAGPRDAGGAAVLLRPDPRRRPARSGSSRPSPKRRRRSTTCSAGPTRSGCSRSSRARRWGCCRACSRGRFYDLVVQIALVRPGPIQGGAVHPFVRRKLGQEEITYPHPKLEPPLERTLGIPVFQEQLMQMAMAVGECSGEDADLLRRAMGSQARAGADRVAAREALRRHGVERADRRGRRRRSTAKIQAFANFGFAESRTRCSFALLVYASRRGSSCTTPARSSRGCCARSRWGSTPPRRSPPTPGGTGSRCGGPTSCARAVERDPREPVAGATSRRDEPAPGSTTCAAPPSSRRSATSTARHRMSRPTTAATAPSPCGSGSPASRASAPRSPSASSPSARRGGPYRSMDDLVRRTGLTARAAGVARHRRRVRLLRAAAAGGALARRLGRRGSRGVPRRLDRRRAAAAVRRPDARSRRSPSDLWATGISTDDHPLAHFRAALDERGVLTSRDAAHARDRAPRRGRRDW